MDKEAGKLKFAGSLITVEDIKKSRDFYEKILGQKVEADYGQNVSFGGFSIHLRPHFQMLIDNKEIVVGGNNFELYFECDDLEQIVEKLKAEKVEFIHELCEAPWKQLGLKFYDPDKNIIEIGETLEHLSFRLHQQGNSFDEISKMTGLSREFIEKSIDNQKNRLEKEIYAKLDNDFIKPEITDEFYQYMTELAPFLCDNFKKRSMTK